MIKKTPPSSDQPSLFESYEREAAEQAEDFEYYIVMRDNPDGL